MRGKHNIALGLFCVAFMGCQETVSLLALNDKGEVVQQQMSQSEYQGQLKELSASVQESALPSLRKTSSGGNWGLRTVVVGIGLKLDFSVGPILGVGFNPGMRFAFSNSVKPNVP